MRKIAGFLLMLFLISIVVVAIGCGGGGYDSGDPKNKPAKDASGITETDEEPPSPLPEGSERTEPPEGLEDGNL